MSKIKTISLDLPSFWASALINGDESGLEDEEQEQLDAWTKDNQNLYCIDVSEETFFLNITMPPNTGFWLATALILLFR